jgi:hypothetical protein
MKSAGAQFFTCPSIRVIFQQTLRRRCTADSGEDV